MIIKGTSRIKDFLKAPGEVKALLLHGSDMGLAGARARTFAVSEGSPLTIDYQTAEEDAVSKATLCVDMFNPPSVVVVKNVKTAPDGFFRDLLTRERLEVRLAIIADRLTPSNKLRNFFETSKELAAIGCYPLQGRELRRAIVDFVQAAGGNIGEDALSFLTSCLPEDWGLVESELGKLLAYADGEKITTQAAEKCLGNEKIAALDELSDALGGGDKKNRPDFTGKIAERPGAGDHSPRRRLSFHRPGQGRLDGKKRHPHRFGPDEAGAADILPA